MNILVACEYSGRVREAFRSRGHNAWSCDLLEAEDGSPWHLQMGWLKALKHYAPAREPYLSGGFCDWDMVIAFPPCTHLCGSGARWWPQKQKDGRQQAAERFFMDFTKLPCRWAVENPIGRMSSVYRKPDQIIQPWMFGHGETKATCLWLNDLPCLEPTLVVDGREARVHKMPPGPNRWKERSRTYEGIAEAMAEQWG